VAANVWEKVSSVSSAADVRFRFCRRSGAGLSSSVLPGHVVPAVTVRAAGAKAKLSISTVAGLAAGCDYRLRPPRSAQAERQPAAAVTPTAPSDRTIRRRRGGGLIGVITWLCSQRRAGCRSGLRGAPCRGRKLTVRMPQVFAQFLGRHLLHRPGAGAVPAAGRGCRRPRGMER